MHIFCGVGRNEDFGGIVYFPSLCEWKSIVDELCGVRGKIFILKMNFIC